MPLHHTTGSSFPPRHQGFCVTGGKSILTEALTSLGSSRGPLGIGPAPSLPEHHWRKLRMAMWLGWATHSLRRCVPQTPTVKHQQRVQGSQLPASSEQPYRCGHIWPVREGADAYTNKAPVHPGCRLFSVSSGGNKDGGWERTASGRWGCVSPSVACRSF